MTARALAEFSKANVAGLTQFEPGRDQNAVDFETSLTFEFEEHGDRSRVAGSAAQYPPAAAKDRTREDAGHARRIFARYRLHLHRPGDTRCLPLVMCRHLHNLVIGEGADGLKAVAELNGA